VLVHDHEVAAVALGEDVPCFLKRGLEGLSAVGRAEQGGDLLLPLLGADAGALRLLPFGMVDLGLRDLRLLLAVALGVLAGHGLMPEFQLQLLAGALMGFVVLAVRSERHGLDVRPRPDDMDVLPAVLLVHDDRARLSLEAEFLLQHVGRLPPLLGRHGVAGVRIDVRVVEALAPFGGFGQGLPVAEGLVQVGGRIVQLQHADDLVGVHPLKVYGQLFRRCAGAAFDDHAGMNLDFGAGGFLPRASRIRSAMLKDELAVAALVWGSDRNFVFSDRFAMMPL
jgi:hypothetical protein